jgi:hypothetical protein
MLHLPILLLHRLLHVEIELPLLLYPLLFYVPYYALVHCLSTVSSCSLHLLLSNTRLALKDCGRAVESREREEMVMGGMGTGANVQLSQHVGHNARR